MSLRVVEDGCRVEGGKLVIVVEGQGPEAVLSSAAKEMAMQKAATFGYVRIGINGSSGSYPVDAEGKQHEDLNAMSRAGLIAAYRNDIRFMGGI